ncbi:MAG: ABC-type lipoprotein export system ATPase subunit [Paracoccaceae bacterium]|jgi:ABC-type lipoprotein export system ATPase subunit
MTAFDLEVRGLSVTAPSGRTLLDVPALSVPAGALLGVKGASGAGKSTLLSALAGLIRPRAGAVLWGGRDISGLGAEPMAAFRRRHLGVMFQTARLFDELSPHENAGIAAGFAPRAEAARITKAAAGFLTRFGLDADARRGAARHSGGERQRIALARALAHSPAAVLADEPTASLDRATADDLIGLLSDLARAQGMTLIVVSHDAALLARMDRVLELSGGGIVDDQIRKAAQ